MDNFGYIYTFWDKKLKRYVYIGQTNNFKRRINEHLNQSRKEDPSLTIEIEIKINGINNYNITKMQFPLFELNNHERYFIRYFQTRDYYDGCNLTDGGDGMMGYKFSEENIRKRSKENHPKAKNPEQEKQLILDKHSNAILGKYFYKKNKNGANKSYCEILDCGCGHSFDLQMNKFKGRNYWCKECRNKNYRGKGNPFYNKKLNPLLHPKTKKYIFTNPGGEKIELFGSFSSFCIENNLNPASMRNQLYGHIKCAYKGWKVCFYPGYEESIKRNELFDNIPKKEDFASIKEWKKAKRKIILGENKEYIFNKLINNHIGD